MTSNLFKYCNTVDISTVFENPSLPWNKHGLSYNKSWEPRLLEVLGPDGWEWDFISQYCDIKHIFANPHLPWDKYGLSRNKSWKPELVQLFGPDGWDWNWISYQCDLKHDENPSLPWVKSQLHDKD